MTNKVVTAKRHRDGVAQRLVAALLVLLSLLQALQADPTSLAEQGADAFRKGDFGQAIPHWEQAVEEFRRQGDRHAAVMTTLSLASAYQAIGHQRHAVEILEAALTQAEETALPSLVARAQGGLGAALVLTRETQRADALLLKALQAARANHDAQLEGIILNDQGNLLVTQGDLTQALSVYQTSAERAREAGDYGLTAQALSNAAMTSAQTGDSEGADALNTRALQAIDHLETSHRKASLLLTTGRTDQEILLTNTEPERLLRRAHRSFEQALRLSETLGDRALQGYALGYLAQLYDQDGQPAAALSLSRRAAFAAQQARRAEALYRWEWQTARLLSAQGEITSAVEAYRRAVQTLQPIRNDVSLGYGNANVRRSFRETEGPLFLELADLLLQQAAATNDAARAQDLLREARDTVEHLKAVELEDYFCDDCVDVQEANTRAVETVDDHTAVVYLIPLPKRTVILVGLTSGLSQFNIDVSDQDLYAKVGQFRRNLETRTTYRYLGEARQLYDWLVRPILGHLREHHIDTLVVVPDGALRTIPFAGLHDGERFLIQEFAVAVTPGLALVEPKPLRRGAVRLLLNGLSDAVQGFPPLDFVPGELDTLEHLYPSDRLFNSTFTLERLEHQLTQEQYSIVHIASHGQFAADVRDTFVLAFDDKLTLNALEALIRPSKYRGQPVELLVLSACQTAAGDDRAALGLAGVAVKAGARSALATLWFVNDQSTSSLIADVYEQLRLTPPVSKARALQAAQIKLLSDRRYRHPCYWSPFLIIGNWL